QDHEDPVDDADPVPPAHTAARLPERTEADAQVLPREEQVDEVQKSGPREDLRGGGQTTHVERRPLRHEPSLSFPDGPGPQAPGDSTPCPRRSQAVSALAAIPALVRSQADVPPATAADPSATQGPSQAWVKSGG